MKTPLLVDRSAGRPTSGLSVAQHSQDKVGPKGCLVIGSKGRVELAPDEKNPRAVTPEENKRLEGLVPSGLLPTRRGLELRVTAGLKTENCDGKGNPSVDRWVRTWEEYPGVVAAVPGKATLALLAAEEIMDAI